MARTALRLRQKISAWASGGPAGGTRVPECLGRVRALPQRGPPCRVDRPCRASDDDQQRWMVFKKTPRRNAPQARRILKFTFSLGETSAESPLCGAAILVNSVSHTGARSSVRLCVGLIRRKVQLRLLQKAPSANGPNRCLAGT
jgi:hypothetical protein